MAWSYSGDPSSSNLDAVRFLIGDTNSTWPYLQDSEINYLLTQRASSVYQAAQDAVLAIIARVAREVDYVIGPEHVNAAKRLTQFQTLHKELKKRWIDLNAAPDFEGNDAIITMNTDLTGDTLFDVGMMDNTNGMNMLDLDDDSDRDG